MKTSKATDSLREERKNAEALPAVTDDQEAASKTGTPEEEQRTAELHRLQGEKKSRRRKETLGGSVSGVVKTAGYLTFVTIIGVVLAVWIIFVANDVFAMSDNLKAKRYAEGELDENPIVEVQVTLGEQADINDIADLLYENGLIKYPSIFRLYAAIRHKSDRNFTAGEYTLDSTMGYDSLLAAFVPSKGKRTEISVTIPEGYCVDDIIDLLVSKGIGSKEGFVKAINEESYDHWFLENVPPMTVDDQRFYRLEGYLYPDTYYFYSDSSEKEAITKMLDNFGLKFRKKYKARCEELGYTMEQIIILASVVQAEGRYESDFTGISSVFHNRLESLSMNYTLQSDATIQYYFRHTEGSKHKEVTIADLETVTPYNSYLNPYLPVGPITNPTISAISAAMYPVESSYYFFVTDVDGNCIYAKTYNEHLKNIEKVKEEQRLLDEAAANAADAASGNE